MTAATRETRCSIQLVARTSAPNGIGARVIATVGSRTLVREVKAGSSYLSQSDTRVHIGLDRAAAVERLEVHWPAGSTEVFTERGGQPDSHHP